MMHIIFLVTFCISLSSAAAPVLMVSIDGLRASDLTSANNSGPKIPALRSLMKTGAFATGVVSVLPSITYPAHTTIITGVSPALHGVSNNRVFDPLDISEGEWYWYSSDIKVPTLWDSVHESGKTVASLWWPVSLGARSIDYNLPEFWRTRSGDESKLIRAISSRGLIARLEKSTGLLASEPGNNLLKRDQSLCAYAVELISKEKPHLTTVHLVSLDSARHKAGLDSEKARMALESIDSMIGTLVESVRRVNPEVVIAIVSDHGFAAVTKEINLLAAFVEAGLVTLEKKTKKIESWKAIPWAAGGSAAVILADPSDEGVKAKVAKMLDGLARNPKNGIAKVAKKQEIEKLGGPREASFFVDAASGYQISLSKANGPLVSNREEIGQHGYFPSRKEMLAAFIISGKSITQKGSLGEIDMRDIAPTLAKVLDVRLPSATGKVLL